MRKCPACGYLLFGDGDACKHCGAELTSLAGAPAPVGAPAPAPGPQARPAAQPTPSFLSAPMGGPAPAPSYPPPAPSAGYTPIPAPASPYAAAPPPPAPGPYGAPPPPPDFGRTPIERDYWTPSSSAVAVKPKRSAPRVVLALISAVSMALGWVAVDRVMNNDPLPSGTSAFVAGHGVAFSSPDHTFDARFPSEPTVEQRRIPVATSSATINLAQVQTDDYEVVAGSMVLPISIPSADVEPALHKILAEAVAAEGAKSTGETEINRFGVPGLEMQATVQDGYPARFMMLISGTHVYLLGVHSKHATKRLYDALIASLIMY